jgi:hypothetical protein
MGGYIEAVRVLRLILLVAVTMLQFHWCGPTFRTSDGLICTACSELSDSLDVHSDGSPITSKNHGDCHDCCELTTCSDSENKGQASASVSQTFEFLALPLDTFAVSVPSVVATSPVAPFEPGRPATGPPSERPSRAPPVHVQSTSAGCADLIV